MASTNKSTLRKRKKKQVTDPKGRVYIKATFNNIIVSFTDNQGGVLTWSSAGHKGFRGARKSTPFAAQSCTKDASLEAYEMGLRTVDIYIKGPGSGRESAIRAIADANITILSINDKTPIPHNGCRPRKARRV